MEKSFLNPFLTNNASTVERATRAAVSALVMAGALPHQRADEICVQIAGVELDENCAGVLSIASLLDLAAAFFEAKTHAWVSAEACQYPSLNVYSGSAGVAYSLLRRGERALAQAETEQLRHSATKTSKCSQVGEQEEPGNVSGIGLFPSHYEGSSSSEAKELIVAALSLLKVNGQQTALKRHLDTRYTFLQGEPGRLALTAVCQNMLQQKVTALHTLRRLAITSFAVLQRLEADQCELLYGRAGLLYALLFTRSVWLPNPLADFDSYTNSALCGPGGVMTRCFNIVGSNGDGKDSHESVGDINLGDGAPSMAEEPPSLAQINSCGSANYGTCMSSASEVSSIGSCCSRIDIPHPSSEKLAEQRESTRVLLLLLLAQTLGQIVGYGQAKAILGEAECLPEDKKDRGLRRRADSDLSQFERTDFPLRFEWHQKEYLGAAHGIAGILLQLLQATDVLYDAAVLKCFPKRSSSFEGGGGISSCDEAEVAASRLLSCSPIVCRNNSVSGDKGKCRQPCMAASAFLCCSDAVAAAAVLRSKVRQLCTRCIMTMLRLHLTETRNLKSSTRSSRDALVQWCHGAPGILPVICYLGSLYSAASASREDILGLFASRSQAAVNSTFLHCGSSNQDSQVQDGSWLYDWIEVFAVLTWERGLLRKGLGICHGIAGNGEALLSVYQATKKPVWLRRAVLFALEGIRLHQTLIDIPDCPLSLFEGLAGFSLFVRDCAELLRSRCNSRLLPTVYYPGYELPTLACWKH